MEVLHLIPFFGTFDQSAPLRALRKTRSLRSFDLSAATDRLELSFQGVVVQSLFGLTTAFSWVLSGLGTNVILAPASRKGPPKLVRFNTGQPLGFLSSWPLFALSHPFVVWYCADKVYPGLRLTKYALLGDDIVIGDPRVAELYRETIESLGVKISIPKSRISECGGLEFANQFIIIDRDLSPISLALKCLDRLVTRLHGCQC